MEFELASFEAAVQHFSHYATGTPTELKEGDSNANHNTHNWKNSKKCLENVGSSDKSAIEIDWNCVVYTGELRRLTGLEF